MYMYLLCFSYSEKYHEKKIIELQSLYLALQALHVRTEIFSTDTIYRCLAPGLSVDDKSLEIILFLQCSDRRSPEFYILLHSWSLTKRHKSNHAAKK